MSKEGSGGAGFTLRADQGSAVVADLKAELRERHAPVLLILNGAHAGLRLSLRHTTTIGRDPTCSLSLFDDGLVSWRHARLEDRGDTWALVDLHSTNGTRLNGEKIAEAALEAGAAIEIGTTRMRYELQDAELEAYGALVDRLMSIDDLSGLFVRRRFDAELKRLLETARTSSSQLALLAMDLDGIKRINDTHGHLFGAYTIGEAGNVIRRLIARERDAIGCRFGGDEFIVALPGCDRTAGVRFAEQVLSAIAGHSFEHEGIRLRPGISIGVAAFPEQAQDAESLFQRADEALYRAKRNGKGQVHE